MVVSENPYAPPAATRRPGGHEGGWGAEAKHIFLQWEKLRVVYLVILGGICLLFLGWTGLALPGVVRTLFAGAIAANLLYFAGPAVEAYVAWLGYRPGWLRPTLFIAGTLLSMLLAVFELVGVTFPHQD